MSLLEPTEVVEFDEDKYKKNLSDNTFADPEDGKGGDK